MPTARRGRVVRRAALALGALAVLAAAPVAIAGVERPVSVDLDGDGRAERLIPMVVKDRYGSAQRQVVLEDRCADGSVFRLEVLPPHDEVTAIRRVEADGERLRPEVLLEGRSGASGLAGMARVLAYEPAGPASACGARPRLLFSYSSTAPRPRPPRGFYVGSFDVRLRHYTTRYRGRELRLWESLVRRGRPVITARHQRVSYFRYSATERRFVRFRSRVSRMS